MLELALENWQGETVGVLRWDPVSGVLEGDQADLVRDMAETAVREGGVMGHPMLTFHAISEPLHDHAQMAVLLGTRWRVPEPLRDNYPVNGQDTDFPDEVVF